MRRLPTYVIVDLDDTIVSFGSRQRIFERVGEEFAEELGGRSVIEAAAEMEGTMRRFWEDAQNSRLWGHRLAESRFVALAPLFEQWGVEASVATRFAIRFHELREDQSGSLFPGAVEALTEFRRRGHRLALLTNGHAKVQREKIARFGLESLFEHIQVDEEVGFGKPDPRSYQWAVGALGGTLDQAAMIGDSLEWEVAAPQRLGMMGVWHDHVGEGLPPDSTVKPDLVFRRWEELRY